MGGYVKIGLKEIEWQVVDWLTVAQDGFRSGLL
jgi:hypothetical protein